MEIKFNSDDDLPLNKLPKFHLMTITIRSVFEGDGKVYQQVFLGILYMNYKRIKKLKNANCKQRIKCYNTIGLIFLKESILIKQICQKNVIFATTGNLKILVFSSINYIFAMVVTI